MKPATLRARLAGPLPGVAAWREMAPSDRAFPPDMAGYRDAAVLLALFPRVGAHNQRQPPRPVAREECQQHRRVAVARHIGGERAIARRHIAPRGDPR